MAYTEIDDDICTDDASAPSLLGVRTRANLAGLADDRTIHGSWMYESPVAASTHPDEWFGVPFLIPAVSGADSVTFTAIMQVANAAMDFSLQVEGNTGSTVSVSAASSTSVTVTCTAPRAPSPDPSDVWRCMFRMRSTESATTVTVNQIDFSAQGGNALFTSYDSGLSVGVSHYSMDLSAYDTDGLDLGTVYVGSISTAGPSTGIEYNRLLCWPSLPSIAGPIIDSTGKSATLTLLSTCTLRACSWAVVGGADAPPVPELYQTGATAYARAVRGLSRYALGIYHRTPHVACPSAINAAGGVAFGQDNGDTPTFGHCHIPQRADVTGWRAWMLIGRRGGDRTLTFDWTITPYAPTAGSALTHSTSAIEVLTSGGPRSSVEDSGLMSLFGLTALTWGARDLSYAGRDSDLSRFQVVAIESPDTSTTGDDLLFEIGTTRSGAAGDTYIAACTIAERIEVTQ